MADATVRIVIKPELDEQMAARLAELIRSSTINIKPRGASMFGCHHRGCPGHDDQLVAILHTLEYLVTTVDQLAQDFATYQTDVQTAFDELKAQIAASNGGTIPADVQAKIDSLDATIQAADVAAKAEVTTPPTTPAAEPAETPPADSPAA